MDFRGPERSFEEADRRYAELKRLHEAGEITEEEFDEHLKRSMVQDEGGRWWSSLARVVSGTTTTATPGYQVPRRTASNPSPGISEAARMFSTITHRNQPCALPRHGPSVLGRPWAYLQHWQLWWWCSPTSSMAICTLALRRLALRRLA